MIYFIQRLHIVTIKNTSSNPNPNATNDYKHTIIMGPPGTGKTEMAKIIGKMYAKLGILKRNMFKKVTRSDLVAGYLGQTAIKTRKVIEECLGGVLFLDEAYSLGTEDAFSKECVDTLCEALSDHRDDLMMIVAGYENELNETFFKVNAGMHSRFMWRFNIESYKPKELMEIFEKKMLENGWEYLEGFMENENKKKEEWFSKNKLLFTHYGRDMELLFSYIKISHAQRIFGKDVSLRKKITEEDLENGFLLFQQNKKEQNKKIYTPPYGMYV
jgi:replication-associated recombination protein RarA